jgi:FlaA1/EpsC-like NDP-sugar epimerase
VNPEQTPSSFDSLVLRLATARVALLFLFHLVVFTACYAFAWLVRFEFVIPAEYLATFKWSYPLVLAVQLLAGAAFGFYRGWWRYVGIADVVRLVFGLSAGVFLLITIWYVGPFTGIEDRFFKAPRGVLLIDWAFTLLSLFGARVVIRLGRERFRPADMPSESMKRILIIGAGDAGETLAREIEHRPQLGMKVVAFVDDQRAKWNSHIRGIRVYGPIGNIGTIADNLGADEALLAIPSASGKRIRDIIHQVAAADLKFKTMPGIDQLVTGRVHVTQIRPVNVEDLLRRRRIELPGDPVRTLFTGKRVLITGAGGTIGSELAAQVMAYEPESLALVERSEYALYEVRKRLAREATWVKAPLTSNLADIRDTGVLDDLIARERPNIVLHAAAHKHVPLGEENPLEYLRNNTIATRRLAEICAKRGVERFVFISTDKAINPTSVMGATKRAGEIVLLDIARDAAMKMTVVRFGNVIGSSGSVIPLFMEQIAAGGPVTVTHPDVARYFIRISEAISLVLQAATLGDGGRIFTLDMGEPVKIADLARDLIRLSNHTEDEIPIVFTGLRPGEKMFEEIRLRGEAIHPTIHPQIVITEAPQPERHVVERWLAQTGSMSSADDRDAAIAALQRLVGEYTSPEPEEAEAETRDALPLSRQLRPAADLG